MNANGILNRSHTKKLAYKHALLRVVSCAVLFLCVVVPNLPAQAAEKEFNAVLWRDPGDISSRNLFYGAGGERHEPPSTVVFVEEDMGGTNPKIIVRDQHGVRWGVKLGSEARPETAATHILWAVGYFTDQDYFEPRLRVKNLPSHLTRGQKYVQSDGTIRNARMERQDGSIKRVGNWDWKRNGFVGTRELNGLRVMMALMNSWDLKKENNAIYRRQGNAPATYLISDLGATFGTTGYSWTQAQSKGNLKSYRKSKFIRKVTADFVDFNTPSRPALIYFVNIPGLIKRMGMRSIGRNIPCADAKWIAQLVGRLSTEQIQDAFRAAGYSNAETVGFATVFQQRVAELNRRLYSVESARAPLRPLD